MISLCLAQGSQQLWDGGEDNDAAAAHEWLVLQHFSLCFPPNAEGGNNLGELLRGYKHWYVKPLDSLKSQHKTENKVQSQICQMF